MVPKSGYRFSEKIMLNNRLKRDDDSKKSHPALARRSRPADAALLLRLERRGLRLTRASCRSLLASFVYVDLIAMGLHGLFHGLRLLLVGHELVSLSRTAITSTRS
jgi:hypothetical protein